MSESISPDRDSYEKVWNEIIFQEICSYVELYKGCIDYIPNAEIAIWKEYCRLNEYCKRNYMQSGESARIDRHKVAACYMIAICTVQPMYFTEQVLNDLSLPVAINETLAITVGLSLLRAFILSSIDNNNQLTDIEKKEMRNIFDGGISFPEGNMVNHGNYIENYANELHYAVSDGKACVLSLSHELYLLEVFTKLEQRSTTSL